VTGAGKTDVYLAAAAHFVAQGQQVLILVPEINLTPQLEKHVAEALPGVKTATLHSRLASGARRRHWDAAADGSARIVLATRLGVFAPLPRLALIVVDEEHDDSYKQHDGVRYHARDLAVWRARERGVPIVLGSATPSLETWSSARSGRYRTLTLPERADVRARLPVIPFVPVRGRDTRDGLSVELRDALATRIAAGEQSLLFINRRGFAPSLKCAACAWERMSALLGAPCRAPAARAPALPPLRTRRRPPRARNAATSTCSRSASARSGSSRRSARSFRPRASHEWTATRRAPRMRLRRCASGSRTASSTSSSARRCSRRGTTFRS
jgi:hypothetical protein